MCECQGLFCVFDQIPKSMAEWHCQWQEQGMLTLEEAMNSLKLGPRMK